MEEVNNEWVLKTEGYVYEGDYVKGKFDGKGKITFDSG